MPTMWGWLLLKVWHLTSCSETVLLIQCILIALPIISHTYVLSYTRHYTGQLKFHPELCGHVTGNINKCMHIHTHTQKQKTKHVATYIAVFSWSCLPSHTRIPMHNAGTQNMCKKILLRTGLLSCRRAAHVSWMTVWAPAVSPGPQPFQISNISSGNSFCIHQLFP